MPQSDGSYNVLLDGQIPLVMEGQQTQLTCTLDPGSKPAVTILSTAPT